MTDQELLQAIGQVVERAVESKIDPLRQDIKGLEARMDRLEARMDRLEARVSKLENDVLAIRIYLDVDQKRTLNLLLEGQQSLWNRFVPQEEFEPLEDRTEVLELTVKRHSNEIRELQLA